MPTVGHILKELDRRRFVNGMAALADLADRHRDLVIRALTRAPASAKVDVGVLVETLTKEAQERATAEAEKRKANANPKRYEALLISQGYVPGFGTASTALRTRTDDVEPDEDLDDAEPTPKKRRGVPRYVPRRLSEEKPEEASEASPARVAAARTRRAVSDVPARYLGPRVFDEFGEVGGSEPADLSPPPWSLPSEEEARPLDPVENVHPRPGRGPY